MSEAAQMSDAIAKINLADARRFEDETILPLFAELRETNPA